jgi:hypothetical protein
LPTPEACTAQASRNSSPATNTFSPYWLLSTSASFCGTLARAAPRRGPGHCGDPADPDHDAPSEALEADRDAPGPSGILERRRSLVPKRLRLRPGPACCSWLLALPDALCHQRCLPAARSDACLPPSAPGPRAGPHSRPLTSHPRPGVQRPPTPTAHSALCSPAPSVDPKPAIPAAADLAPRVLLHPGPPQPAPHPCADASRPTPLPTSPARPGNSTARCRPPAPGMPRRVAWEGTQGVAGASSRGGGRGCRRAGSPALSCRLRCPGLSPRVCMGDARGAGERASVHLFIFVPEFLSDLCFAVCLATGGVRGSLQ